MDCFVRKNEQAPTIDPLLFAQNGQRGREKDGMSQQRSFWTTRQEDEETVTLPAIPGVRQRSKSPMSLSQPEIVTQLQGKAIWIIDDSPTIRAVTRFHLNRLGITVHPFGDGLEALIRLRQFPDEAPPLILVDLELPRMDGYTVVKSLRALLGSAQVKIVMISGRDAALDRLKGRLAGADDYLIKPITYDTLLTVALTYLGGMVPQISERPEDSVRYVL